MWNREQKRYSPTGHFKNKTQRSKNKHTKAATQTEQQPTD